MKTIIKIIMSLGLLLLLTCSRDWDNPLQSDDDLKNTPNIIQISKETDNNISIVLDYAYSDSSTIIVERKSLGGFENIKYIKRSQTMLIDTSFNKENNHNFVYRISVRKGKYRSSYSDENKFSYISDGLNQPTDFFATSIELQGVNLTWKDESNYEEEYIIEKNDGSGFIQIASLSSNKETYLDEIPGTPTSPLSLAYRIKASNNELESDWSEISVSYSGIGSPTNLIIAANNYSNVNLEWEDNSNTESGYIIERKWETNEFGPIDTVAVNSITYTDIVPDIGSYNYRVCAVSNNQKSIYSNEVNVIITILTSPIPTDGLIAYWPFNGNANDESDNSNDGIVYQASLTEDRFGNPNSAYNFDGIDDNIDIGNGVKPNFPVTISLWFNANTFQEQGGLFRNDFINSGSSRYGLLLLSNFNGQVAASVFRGFSVTSNRKSKWSDENIINIGEWNNFLVIFHSITNIELFINSEILNSNFDDGTASSLAYSNNNGGIGNRNDNYNFNGKIDDIRVYDRVLTSKEIQAIYHEGGWSK